MQQQQTPIMAPNKVKTPANKHNSMLFFLMNMTEFVLLLVVVCSTVSTTELRGSFYYNDHTNMILKPDGYPCEQFIIYKVDQSPKDKWNERFHNSGYATLKSEGSKEPSSGRILTVLERSMKVTADEGNSTTGELRMRVSLLFEWKTGHSQLDMSQMPEEADNLTESILHESSNVTSMNMTLTNTTSTDNTNISTIPPLRLADSISTSLETSIAGTNKSDDAAASQIQPGLRFPNGSHSYKFTKMEAIRDNKPPDDVFDPFKHVAIQLLFFSLFGFLQIIIQICRCLFSDFDGHYSACELIVLLFSFVIWCVVLSKAFITSMNWDSIWMCTNFRPEKPQVFLVTAICSSVLVVLFLFEALYACDMMFDEATEKAKREVKSKAPNPSENNAIVASPATTSILLPFTAQNLGGNIQQAKLIREDLCMVTVKEN
ncbi:hypothetical protein Mgra_00009757 [Meloidogyne graminicola]|uniref:Uncharacterized protein n=1 Tax=Meloidogyne graminicola TaxID=189291 RepID=A0A8S9Z8L2_9BILA|nr:hypothetical protein Mgra_00009757 [Meloidogyne graminicola]